MLFSNFYKKKNTIRQYGNKNKSGTNKIERRELN